MISASLSRGRGSSEENRGPAATNLNAINSSAAGARPTSISRLAPTSTPSRPDSVERTPPRNGTFPIAPDSRRRRLSLLYK